MTPAHDETATTWRDLVDQLTPQQVVELEYCEREEFPPGLASPGNHLNHARKLVELNLARAMYADVAPPADAIEVDDWSDWDRDVYLRMFVSWFRREDGVSVEISGFQSSDGLVERSIVDTSGDNPMSAGLARQRAAALLEAADELDRLGQ